MLGALRSYLIKWPSFQAPSKAGFGSRPVSNNVKRPVTMGSMAFMLWSDMIDHLGYALRKKQPPIRDPAVSNLQHDPALVGVIDLVIEIRLELTVVEHRWLNHWPK